MVGAPKDEMTYRRGMLRQERACKVGMSLLELENEVYRCWASYFQLARALGWGIYWECRHLGFYRWRNSGSDWKRCHLRF